MAGEKLRTTIEIGVDDRQVRGLGRSLDAALNPRVLDRFVKGIDRATSAVEKLVKAAKKLEDATQQAGAGFGGPVGAPGGAGGGSGYWGGGPPRPTDPRLPRGTRESPVETRRHDTFMQRMQRYSATSNAVGGSVIPTEGFVSRSLGALPFVGGFLGGAINAVQQFAQYRAAYDRALANTSGVTGVSRTGRATAAYGGIGLSATEALPVLAQLAGSSSLHGEDLLALTSHAARLQGGLGIGAGASGAIVGAAMTGMRPGAMGGPESAALMEATLSAGVEIGIHRAHLSDFMQEVAHEISSLREQGIMIEPDAMTGLARVLATAGTGFVGQAGVRAAMGMAGSLRGAGDRSGAFSAFAMQAAGFGSGVSAFEAARRLEEDPLSLVPEVVANINRYGGSAEARAMAIRQLFMEGGHTLSRTQALSLAQMDPEVMRANLAAARGPAGMPGTDVGREIDAMIGEGMAGTGGAAALAGLENQRIAVGGVVAPLARDITRFELSTAETAARAGMRAIRALQDELASWAETARTEGLGGVARRAARGLVDAVGDTVRDINRSTLEALGVDPEGYASGGAAIADRVTAGATALSGAVASAGGMVGLPPDAQAAIIAAISTIANSIATAFREIPALLSNWLMTDMSTSDFVSRVIAVVQRNLPGGAGFGTGGTVGVTAGGP